jgi:hypothetical protein
MRGYFSWAYLIDLVSLTGFVGAIGFIPWTKMALGGALTVLGAFYPNRKEPRQPQEGSGHLEFFGVSISLKGGIRFAVVFAGILLVAGSVVEGYAAAPRGGIVPLSEAIRGAPESDLNSQSRSKPTPAGHPTKADEPPSR